MRPRSAASRCPMASPVFALAIDAARFHRRMLVARRLHGEGVVRHDDHSRDVEKLSGEGNRLVHDCRDEKATTPRRRLGRRAATARCKRPELEGSGRWRFSHLKKSSASTRSFTLREVATGRSVCDTGDLMRGAFDVGKPRRVHGSLVYPDTCPPPPRQVIRNARQNS